MADPFGNPFGPSEHVDRAPTGSVPPVHRQERQERIVGQPLSAPHSTASYSPPASNPAPVSSAALSPPPVASTPRGPAASFSNWTSQGGTPVVMAQGESVKVLSDRYGVPAEALVRTNGFSSAAQISPGTRLIIPVYSVSASHTATAAPAPAAEPARPHIASREPATPRHETLRMVKGPEPVRTAPHETEARTVPQKPMQSAAKAKLLERTKVAHVRAEEVAPPPVKTKSPVPVKTAAVREEVKPVAPKIAREEKPLAPKMAREEKTVSPKVAREEKSVREEKVAREERTPVVDPAPTASLPPPSAAKPEKTADAGSPEFRWPARGRVIQGFKAGGNDGINIAVPEGTAVKAAEDGVVAYAGSELKGYGNLVLVRHPNGFVSAYANNGSIDVKRGDTVKRGQTIAKSGQSGNVSSPQLHFELRKGAQPVDPSTYLAGN